jgi:hypothetical protein
MTQHPRKAEIKEIQDDTASTESTVIYRVFRGFRIIIKDVMAI